MPHTLLLTGFEPFGQWQVNPSWEIARRLDGEAVGGLHVKGRRLPVSWADTWPALLQAIEETQPDAVLMLGLAGKRLCISVEAQGLNRCARIEDNAGKHPASDLIDEGGDETVPATIPVVAIVERIGTLGLPAEVSQDAGGYLCNYAVYRALQWANSERATMPVGFIHLPNIKGTTEDAGGLTLEEMGSAISAAIETIAGAVAAKP